MDEQAQRVQSYIDALVEEKLKIQVFQRELPLCLDLVNKAIENYRQQLSGTTTTDCFHGGHSECSEETSTPGPVLEEFIPIKRPCSGSNDDDDELDSVRQSSHVKGTPSSNDNKTKSDWLRSAQLWNQTTPDLLPKDVDPPPKRVPVLQVSGAFKPFNREQGTIFKTGYTSKQSSLTLDKLHSPIPAASTSSTAETVIRSGSKEEREPVQQNRKQRRNWSPELHHRFLQALQQLGGSHAGTPKQIRELMKVDGLTNDEVKSHLQKYRLHTRRPSPSSTAPAAGAQATQFVFMGGIWVPPAAAVPASAPSASAAPLPADSNQKKSPDDSEGRGSHSANGEEEARGNRSHSPATSSSSHTTTESRHH